MIVILLKISMYNRVPTGSGIPGKVLEFYFQFPGPWKSWNFYLNPGKK